MLVKAIVLCLHDRWDSCSRADCISLSSLLSDPNARLQRKKGFMFVRGFYLMTNLEKSAFYNSGDTPCFLPFESV